MDPEQHPCVKVCSQMYLPPPLKSPPQCYDTSPQEGVGVMKFSFGAFGAYRANRELL